MLSTAVRPHSTSAIAAVEFHPQHSPAFHELLLLHQVVTRDVIHDTPQLVICDLDKSDPAAQAGDILPIGTRSAVLSIVHLDGIIIVHGLVLHDLLQVLPRRILAAFVLVPDSFIPTTLRESLLNLVHNMDGPQPHQ